MKIIPIAAFVVVLASIAGAQSGGPYQITQNVIAGGGGDAVGGVSFLTVRSAKPQPASPPAVAHSSSRAASGLKVHLQLRQPRPLPWQDASSTLPGILWATW
jgi:hypothetical protein